LRFKHILALAATAMAVGAPATATASSTGGAEYGAENPALRETVPGKKAVLLESGLAAAPEAAPQPVKDAIWKANEIIGLPYRLGGGHKSGFTDDAFDCSGTVSYALSAIPGLLETPLDSGSFMRWGKRGRGSWITVFTNPGHAYVVIAGLRLDTSAAGDPSGLKGPRWRPTLRSSRGFKARSPKSL
jgi:hypothetical protein